MMRPSTMNDYVADLQERFQRLRDVETRKYICPDYASGPVLFVHLHSHKIIAASGLRLQHFLAARERTLRALYGIGIDGQIMGNASFIFDRYLSTIIPDYVRGLKEDLPHRIAVIGAACVFIAAKMRLDRREIWTAIERFHNKNLSAREVFDVEMKILVELKWDVVYPPPITLVGDMIELLPRPCGYTEHDDTLESFKTEVLNEASYLAKLASVTYGFVAKFPPTTIALSSLMIALEKQRSSSSSITLFGQVGPIDYFTIMFEACELGLSFDDNGAKKCRQRMLQVLESYSSGRDPIATRPSPILTHIDGEIQ